MWNMRFENEDGETILFAHDSTDSPDEAVQRSFGDGWRHFHTTRDAVHACYHYASKRMPTLTLYIWEQDS